MKHCLQTVNQHNDCDAVCENTNQNSIFDISQSNLAQGSSNTNQSNLGSLSQVANQQNDCDESGNNDNFITCSNVVGGAILGDISIQHRLGFFCSQPM